MRFASKVWLPVVGAVVGALLSAAPAQAAPGDLTFGSCAADTSVSGVCTDIPQAPLNDPRAVAVSPDGSDVYVASGEQSSVSHFTVGADGRPTFADCVGNTGANGCVDLAGTPLTGAESISISPDGGSVYVASRGQSILTHLFVGPSGALGLGACFSNAALAGCTDLAGRLNTPEGSTVSPDGRSLYVALGTSALGGISHFSRTPAGDLTFLNCSNNNGSSGCSDIPGTFAMGTATAIAVSPDNEMVFVAAGDGFLNRFAAGPNGTPTWAACVGNDTSNGCTDLPGEPLTGASDIAISPGGDFLYVGSRTADSATRFSVDAAGQTTLNGCISDNGLASVCQDAPGQPFNVLTGLDISPDGGDVYTASFFGATVSRLLAPSGGGLSFAGCLSQDGSAGTCSDLPGDLGAYDIAVAPDGGSAYVTDLSDDALIWLRRELAAPPDTTPPGLTVKAAKGEAGKPIKVRVSCDEACSVDVTGRAKPKGSKKGKLKPAAADLAPGASATLKLRPKGKLKRALKRSGRGKATIVATATDTSGNAADATAKVKLK